MKPAKMRRHRFIRGLTLIEVLVAITICSVALVVMCKVIVAAQRTTMKGDYYNIATQAASDQIVNQQTTNFGSLVEGTTTSAVAGLPSGQMVVTIGPLDGDSGNTDIEQIDVVVTWTGATGSKELGGQVKMSTLISNV